MKLLTTKLVKKRSTVLVSVAQFCTALLVFSQDIRDVLELVVAENLGGNAPDAVFTFNLNVFLLLLSSCRGHVFVTAPRMVTCLRVRYRDNCHQEMYVNLSKNE